ncbi:MAG: LCP family protein [Acutalibacter sp.]|jgi:LCP family protein required for cell wall assembly|uniref:LCP family protein n=1 Tax=Acutalibacter sp. TaxID=1918636 RepID=UPI002171EF5C|nr:LCP family protein [Acutalibacter sp.]MCI9225824.1 LCP family protein [Acutalibacter sp.]
MGQKKDNRAAGRHSAPAGRERPRREALKDNYYYEDRQFEDVSSYSSESRRQLDRAAVKRAKMAPQRQGPARRGRSAPKPKRRINAGAVIAWMVFLLVVGGVGLFIYMFSGLKVTDLGGDLAVSAGQAGVKNIAMFGVDSRDGENVGRSDAVMVLSIDSRSHTLKMSSFMRDSNVYIEGYGYDKLTHAYAYGGPELAVRTINQNFRLDITDYITVNFYDMTEIVDAFGGVELELTGEEMLEVNRNLFNLSREAENEGSKAPIRHDDYFTATDGTHNMIDGEFIGGKYLLNGAQAVAYSRIRYIGGDGERTSRQHEVLKGLLQRAKQRTVFSWPSIVHGVVPHCETSMDFMDMVKQVPFAFGHIKMESATFPGAAEGAYDAKNENGQYVMGFDEELMRENLHRFIYGDK